MFIIRVFKIGCFAEIRINDFEEVKKLANKIYNSFINDHPNYKTEIIKRDWSDNFLCINVGGKTEQSIGESPRMTIDIYRSSKEEDYKQFFKELRKMGINLDN